VYDVLEFDIASGSVLQKVKSSIWIGRMDVE